MDNLPALILMNASRKVYALMEPTALTSSLPTSESMHEDRRIKEFLFYRCVDPEEDRVAVVLGGYTSSSSSSYRKLEVYATFHDKGSKLNFHRNYC